MWLRNHSNRGRAMLVPPTKNPTDAPANAGKTPIPAPIASPPAGLAGEIVMAPVPNSRPEADRGTWAKTVDAIKGTLNITEGDTLATPLAGRFRRLEDLFTFTPRESDEAFKPLHIEPLLDQAADLLDRAIRDRAAWDELASKTLSQSLELGQYAELELIRVEEETAGVYDVASEESKAAAAAERKLELTQDSIYNSYLSLHNDEFSNPRYDEVVGSAEQQAWASALGAWNPNADSPQFGWNGKVQHIWDHVYDAVTILQSHALQTERRNLQIQYAIASGLTEISRLRQQGLAARSSWDAANAKFQRRRQRIAQKYQDRKALAATDGQGALNYSKRMAGIKDRFDEDFRAAYARLKAISQGLSEVYNYSEALPVPDGNDLFDASLLWVRKTIDWLVRFSRNDQSYILPLSIRALSKGKWQTGLDEGVWSFEVPIESLDDQRFIRLRGLSAFVVETPGSSALWHLVVQAPTSATTRYADGSTGVIDQSRIPTCRLARVTAREFPRDSDTVGIATLHNASPIGRWIVRVAPSLMGADLKNLSDIHLDLHLAVRTGSLEG